MHGTILAPLVQAAQARNLHIRNIVVRQHNHIIARHDFMPETPRMIFSVSKTFVSMGVGIAQAEGALHLQDSIAEYLPRAKQHPGFAEITLENLLTMTSGHAACPIISKRGITDFEAEFYAEPLLYAPGTHFVYNNGASYMLSKIITVATGQSLLDYLDSRLFAPLGIPCPQWAPDKAGVTLGFSQLHLTASELSRAGQLLLNGGVWGDRQLIPQEYVAMATRKRVDTGHIADEWATEDSRAGYGYQLWMNAHPGSYRMDGYMGQYVAVLPDRDAVVTYVSDEPENMLGILALTWEFLLDRL